MNHHCTGLGKRITSWVKVILPHCLQGHNWSSHCMHHVVCRINLCFLTIETSTVYFIHCFSFIFHLLFSFIFLLLFSYIFHRHYFVYISPTFFLYIYFIHIISFIIHPLFSVYISTTILYTFHPLYFSIYFNHFVSVEQFLVALIIIYIYHVALHLMYYYKIHITYHWRLLRKIPGKSNYIVYNYF